MLCSLLFKVFKMASYHTMCKCCDKKFKTLYSLLKHYEIKHPESYRKETYHEFVDDDGVVVQHPKPGPVSEAEDSQGYRLWISGLTERINGALHPCLPGKWFKIECPQTLKKYFNFLLSHLGCPLYSVRQAKHRLPIYSRAARRLSYKLFNLQKFLELFSINQRILFCGENEVVDSTETHSDECSATELLKAAEERGNKSYSQRIRPTSRSEIVVGLGEGRATREVELIWWPDIYHSYHGKLTIRFFIEKVKL